MGASVMHARQADTHLQLKLYLWVPVCVIHNHGVGRLHACTQQPYSARKQQKNSAPGRLKACMQGRSSGLEEQYIADLQVQADCAGAHAEQKDINTTLRIVELRHHLSHANTVCA